MKKRLKQTVMSYALVMIAFTANVHARSAANPSAEEQYQRAKKLFDKGAHANAFSLLKMAATPSHRDGWNTNGRLGKDKGHPPAMNAVGYCYQFGKGVSKDYAKALEWYKKAAVQGDATGAYNYGCMHLKGLGVRKNNDIAKKWLTTAANAGNTDAKTILKRLLNAKSKQPDKPKQPKKETSKNSDKPEKSSSRRTSRVVRDSNKPERRPRPTHSGTFWYTGSWNSTINNLIDHPKTVCLRIVVVDKETRLPVSNVQISFEGDYWIAPKTSRDKGGERNARKIGYKTSCRTDSKGMAVASFTWNKEYPWSFGTDEVEKAQKMTVKHPLYKYKEFPTPFSRFLKVGQKKTKPYPIHGDTFQESHVLKAFKKALETVYSQSYTEFVVLDLGTKYSSFDQNTSTRSEFFEKVYSKTWGEVFDGPRNLFKKGAGRGRSWCGPYLIYDIKFKLHRSNR